MAPVHTGGIERGGGARSTKQGTWRAKRSSSSRNRSRGGRGFMDGERRRGRELGAPAAPRTAKAGGSGRPASDPGKRQRGRRSSWAELLVVPHGGSCEEKQREGARCERRSMEPGKKREWRGRDGATERRRVAREAAGAGVARRRRGGHQERRHAAAGCAREASGGCRGSGSRSRSRQGGGYALDWLVGEKEEISWVRSR